MKKFIIFVLSLALLFAACAKISEPTPSVSLPTRIKAGLKGSEGSFIAEISESQCKITFEYTHSLTGTTLFFDENGGKAVIGDFSREIDIRVFPAQNALIKAVRGISKASDSGIKTNGGFKYTIDEMTIMVYYNKDTKALTAIETEESGRRFVFEIVSLEPI